MAAEAGIGADATLAESTEDVAGPSGTKEEGEEEEEDDESGKRESVAPTPSPFGR